MAASDDCVRILAHTESQLSAAMPAYEETLSVSQRTDRQLSHRVRSWHEEPGVAGASHDNKEFPHV
jgi:hypothetical protein